MLQSALWPLAACARFCQGCPRGMPRASQAFPAAGKCMQNVDGKWLGVAALALMQVGCASQMIPNTDVEDTTRNRSVVQFCEEYRHAVEQRNIARLLLMAHPNYYEDGGNIDSSDDIDFAGLKDFLETKFRDTKAIRYEIRYRRVGQGRKDIIYVDYTYSASYKLNTDSGEVWRRTVADNRIEMVADGEKYKILSGM
jgi:hypothetical protein